VLGLSGVHGLVDGGLEAGLVDDEVGVADGAHLGGGELQVVGLGGRGREVVDAHQVAAHLLGHVLQGVEGRQHLQRAVVGPGARAVGGAGGECDRGQGERGGGGEGATKGRHENHSQA
jgi:hypothetical protein